ncbi:Phosphatidylinositol transfer protein - like 1 [Theobroma cacao]|nr:Phosphatidylinositol transfer protein - like 1 [Theobroma cacao]
MDFILRSDQGNYLLLLRHILWAFLVNILISCDSMLIDLTSLQCPYFTKFCLTIETVHRADNGTSENVHFLNEEQLAARQVETIDIASAATDYWSYAIGSNTFDFSKFKSAKTGRGPLLDGWQDNCNPVMTAYKLVTVDAPYWGFGYRLEQALLAGERALFMESHRNCFGWIDEWFGMTMQQIRELEQQGDCLLKESYLIEMKFSFEIGTDAQILNIGTERFGIRRSKRVKISKPILLTNAEDCDQRFSHNSERHVQQVVHT